MTRAGLRPVWSATRSARWLKSDGRLDRNPLKGALGDALHAVLCGAGHNIRLLLRLLRLFAAHLRAAVLAWLRRVVGDRASQVAWASA